MGDSSFRRLFAANKTFYTRTAEVESNHLAPHDMKRIGIDCSDLDLDLQSALPSDVLMRPFPRPKLHAFLEKTRPFDTEYALLPSEDKDIFDALGISNLISAYMKVSVVRDEEGLLSQTTWIQRGMDVSIREILTLEEDIYNWRVEVMFDKMDGITPHISLVLADAAPLEMDKLSFAEMACIYVVTASRLRRKVYRRHRIIPVTVISLSGMSARVVHGYVDVEANKVKVFKSPILNLDKEDYKPEMEILVSWCIGTPIGSTLWVQK